jgi:outer membrane beta-barrel protein
MRVTAAVGVALALLAIAAPATAQDLDESEGLRTLAVQNRHHHHWHDLSIGVGILPLDAFRKGLTLSGTYTLHFNHIFAWEIVRAYGVVVEFETNLNDDLNNLSISPTAFETVEWAATSSFVFTPFYGKFAVVNRSLLFGEIFLVAGAGYGFLTNSSRVVVNAGGGLRFFFGEYFSLRFDIRWEGFVSSEDMHNELWLNLGASVHLG